MTIALGRPVGRHPASTAGLRTLVSDMLAGLASALRRPKGAGRHSGGEDRPHIGATETTPVLDAPPVTDSLDPTWQPFEPDRAPAVTYDELAAASPVRLDWAPESFTETWNAATLRAQLDAEDAEAGAR